ncbi:MAG: phosphotransferase [Desulfobacula sp.]|jgi:hypothetical protein|nr:phosphotransferase [Deltaproteobacteria bacterium]MBT4639527.1 phosphotransferase [Deltaproteobacteria bacterium]MBT5547335.1 phosphotransferase [Desulfobacula sp.]MBT7711228.1 phosphotransferase [Deltaproteobacteria bacterium]
MAERMIPNTIEEITPEWLTQSLTQSGVLQNNIVGKITPQIIGEETGYMGILARLHLEYEKPEEKAPATMIAKIPTQQKKNKMLSEAFMNFERENHCYSGFLDNYNLKTPTCYFSDFDAGFSEKKIDTFYHRYGTLPNGLLLLYFLYTGLRNVKLKRRYILLIEDFKSFEYIDQRIGCSFDDAKLVIQGLGKGQSSFWNSPQLDKYWLRDHADMPNIMNMLSQMGIKNLKKSFKKELSQKELDVFDWFKKNSHKLDLHSKTRPHTLLHADYRLDNLFFDRKKNEIAVLDWQTCCPGMGVMDAAYFLLHGGSQAFTADQATELIKIYHQALVDNGVEDYSYETCLDDYKYGLMLAIRYVLIIAGGTELNDPAARKLGIMWLERWKPIFEAIDLNTLLNN